MTLYFGWVGALTLTCKSKKRKEVVGAFDKTSEEHRDNIFLMVTSEKAKYGNDIVLAKTSSFVHLTA